MLKSNFEFEVLVNGHPAKEYYHNGKYFIEGREGSRFSLRMRNNSSHRVLFVPTVDGLSIMNGKEASYKSQGYVVSSYDSLTIDGWRTSDNNVAEFFFSSPKGSYAGKKSKGGNLGVLGCAVFKEKERRPDPIIIKEYIPIRYPDYQRWPTYPFWGVPYTNGGISSGSVNFYSCSTGGTGRLQNASLSSSAINNCVNGGNSQTTASNSSGEKVTNMTAGLGTGFGQDKYSPVSTVDFDKESSPSEVFTIFYNTRENLEAAGVEFKKAVYVAPSAFPNEDGYCERPN